MSYVEKYLAPDEKVIFVTRYHPWFWLSDLASMVGGVFLIILLNGAYPSTPTNQAMTAGKFCLGLLLVSFPILCFIASLLMISRFMIWLTSDFRLTNQQIIVKAGMFIPKVIQIPLSELDSCKLSNSAFVESLGFDRVVLRKTNGKKYRFTAVAQAKEFRDRIIEQMTGTGHVPQSEFFDTLPPLPTNSSQTPKTALTADQLLKQAVEIVKSGGDRRQAKSLVNEALKIESGNADGWYLSGYLADTKAERKAALDRTLMLNPNHKRAQQEFARLANG